MVQKSFAPKTVDEALQILSDYPDTSIIAGGTDLMVRQNDSLYGIFADTLMSVRSIEGFDRIEELEDEIVIAPAANHSDIAVNPIILKYAPHLAKAASIIGSPQIRNMGTIGGNVCNSSPVGDTLPALYTLDAVMVLRSASGSRTLPINEFIFAPGKNRREKGELLTEIRFPKREAICRFERTSPRKALSITKASVAFLASLKAGVLKDVKIAMGSVGPVIIFAKNTQNVLENKHLSEELIEIACKTILTDSRPISDIRSTAEYRLYITSVLLRRVLRSIL